MSRSALETVIRKVPGAEAAAIVETLLRPHGSTATARDIDLFFVAEVGDTVIGSVRFCVEENTPMLRTMMIHEQARGRRVGSKLLEKFREHVVENRIENVYCLPYAHLVKFYSQIGFEVVDEDRLPAFLQTRLKEYRAKSSKTFTAMRRN